MTTEVDRRRPAVAGLTVPAKTVPAFGAAGSDGAAEGIGLPSAANVELYRNVARCRRSGAVRRRESAARCGRPDRSSDAGPAGGGEVARSPALPLGRADRAPDQRPLLDQLHQFEVSSNEHQTVEGFRTGDPAGRIVNDDRPIERRCATTRPAELANSGSGMNTVASPTVAAPRNSPQLLRQFPDFGSGEFDGNRRFISLLSCEQAHPANVVHRRLHPQHV